MVCRNAFRPGLTRTCCGAFESVEHCHSSPPLSWERYISCCVSQGTGKDTSSSTGHRLPRRKLRLQGQSGGVGAGTGVPSTSYTSLSLLSSRLSVSSPKSTSGMGWLESSEGASLPRGVLSPGGRVKDWDGAAGAAAAVKRLPDSPLPVADGVHCSAGRVSPI